MADQRAYGSLLWKISALYSSVENVYLAPSIGMLYNLHDYDVNKTGSSGHSAGRL